MSKQVKIIAGLGLAVTLLVVLLVSTTLAQGPWRNFGLGGMMDGWGSWGYGVGSARGITDSVPYGYGPSSMMGGCPIHSDRGWGSPGTVAPISMDQAVEAIRQYLKTYDNADLALTEVMEFSNHFYVEVEEESTGVHAFELLINRYTGAVYPEPGPNMMWNTKYGHMRGMMGGWWGRPSGSMTVTPEQARTYAQQWLDANLPGTTVADEADAFHGYYTIHILQDGQIVGMLSVHGYSGQVWYHTWHGAFVAIRELEE